MSEWRRFSFKAMGGPCDVRVQCGTDEPVRTVMNEVARLERKYSRYLDDSVTSRINRNAGRGHIAVDAETLQLLRYADDAWRISDGLFDITSGVFRAAWDFRKQRIPAPGELEALRTRVGWDRVTLTDESLELPAGMEIDFGGIVKEYAADRCAWLLRKDGFCGLVELAGDIAVTGPLPDGTRWEIGVRNPRVPDGVSARLVIDGGGVATSGDYERCILIEGRRYSHLLDPHTGWPVHGLASVTVRHASCTVAGTLATVAMLKGREGEAWLRDQGIDAVCIAA